MSECGAIHVGLHCPNATWISFGSYCYYILTQRLTFFDAYGTCMRIGGFLAAPTDTMSSFMNLSQIAALDFALPGASWLWIGLFNSGGATDEIGVGPLSNPFYYFDGTPLSNDILAITSITSLQNGACSYVSPQATYWHAVAYFPSSAHCNSAGIIALCQYPCTLREIV